jgi:hypothetical protein
VEFSVSSCPLEEQLQNKTVQDTKSEGTGDTGSLEPMLPKFAQTNMDSDERFLFGVRKLLQTICSAQRPVILFIDDWQWADLASTQLFEEIMKDKEI